MNSQIAGIQYYPSIKEINPDIWQSLRQDDYPFLDYQFLVALEDNQCVGDHTNWQPLYLVKTGDLENKPEFILPCYIKYDSQGEFVFDGQWAEAYARYGLNYYPKLINAIAFTPVSGARWLSGKEKPDLNQIPKLLKQTLERYKLSGFHSLFLDDSDLFKEQPDIHMRTGCQFHWFNQNYQSFEHYLEHFSSRKRKNTLKERKKIKDQNIHIQLKTGADITEEDIQFFYYCYQITYFRHHHVGYLNEGFFQQLRQTMSDQTLLVMAFQSGKPVAASWFMFDQKSLYGRYWGALDELDSLHFECCYYQGIEFCIQKNLSHFDPGIQGEHKISRGFQPVLSHSYHHLAVPEFNQAIGEFVQQEKDYVLAYAQQCEQKLPFKQVDEVKA